MTKALQILTERRDALMAERDLLESQIAKGDARCNIESFNRTLDNIRVWIFEIQEGIKKLSE